MFICLINVKERIQLMDTLKLANQVEQYVIDMRRDFHKYPEISLQEKRTIEVITKKLETMGIDFEIVPNGGVLGTIKGKKQGKTLILRADMDALPMTEATTNLKKPRNVISENKGAAHMCGHDGHSAMLLGVAKVLSENNDSLRGNVILAFEQGEENGAGIQGIMERLIELGADGVWGMHLQADIPAGKVSVDPGPRMASAFVFNTVIKGSAGHGSRPDLANSPLDCFTDFYNNLKSMRINSLDPFKAITYSIGTITSGFAPNVVPETLQFSGTARFLHYDQGLKAEKEFKRLLVKTCDLHRCSYEFIREPVAKDLLVYNHEQCATLALEAVNKSIGTKAVYNYPAWLASESFGYYQKYFPGVFAFLGIKNQEKGTGADHHNPHFDIDEDVLKLGVAITLQYTIDFLNSDKKIQFTSEKRDIKELMM